jgi:2'-hydroxyisoflavone reductase
LLHTGLASGALAAAAACGGTTKTGGPTPPPGGGDTPPEPAKPTPRTILILGGTGFLGPAIVEAARARGHTLTLFNRGKTNPGLFPDVEKLQGDRDGQLAALEGRKWDAVVDTSGYVPRIVKMSADLLAPNVGQYIFISSISVYADPLAAHSDESAPIATMPDPTNEEVRQYYGALKALCEQAAEKSMPGRTCAVRPGLIVGPGDPTDRFTYWPVRLQRGGEVLAPGDGNDPGQVVDVRDLGEWLVHLIEENVTGTFNAVGPAETMTMRAMLEACRTAAGTDARLTWVDTKFLEEQQVAPWMELPVWTGSDPGFATVSATKAIAKGLKFRPILDTCQATLTWWNAQPEERRAKLRTGLAPEKEAQVLAAWHARKP